MANEVKPYGVSVDPTQRSPVSGTKASPVQVITVGDLVLTVNGIYRWAGSTNTKKGTLSVTDDYRFNSVPSVFALREDIAPAALSMSLNLADVRISVRENKNLGPYSVAKWIGEIEGEDEWTSWGYVASEALLKAARFIAIRDWHENGCPQVGELRDQSATLNEMPVYSVLGDFEEGDRIFQPENESSYTLTGTIVSVEGDHLVAQIGGNSGNPTEIITIGDTDNPWHLSQWRKLPNEALIEVGDIMSTVFPGYCSIPKSREYFTVTKIEPGEIICLQSLASGYHSLEFDDDEYGSLDQYLQHWELEG